MIFVLAAMVIAMVIVACVLAERQQRNFYEKWPAIDDDEFVRHCPPGTDRETALKVRRIVSEQLSIPYENIYPEQSFIDDLEA